MSGFPKEDIPSRQAYDPVTAKRTFLVSAELFFELPILAIEPNETAVQRTPASSS